jgi:hypothetical protein
MSRQLSESAIVYELSEQLYQRLTRKLITTLQKLDSGGMSGDDSPLRNVWDEICVQIQHESSIFWDTYDDTVRGLAEAEVAQLSPYEREAMWLRTPEWDDWDCEDESDRDPYPVANDDIARYLMTEYLYEEAGNWSNPRIRQYLDHSW